MSTTASSPISSSAAGSSGGRSRAALVIPFFLFLNFAYFLFSSGRVRTIDEVSAAFQVESLAKRGATAIPQAVEANQFYGTFDRFGRPQSPYPPGQAFALLPWYVAGQFAGRHLPGVPRALRDAFSDFFLTGESAFFSALAAALSLYIFLELGIAPKISLLAAGILAFATPLAAYSGWLYSEPLAAALLLAAAAVLFSTPQTANISILRGLSAGVFLGAAVWVRPTHVIAVPVFLVALFVGKRKKGWRPAIALAVAVGVSAALLLWRDAYLHGSFWDFGYPAAAEGGKALNTFETPLATGLRGFLVSPGKSIFLFSPPILLAMLGLPRLWRRDWGLAVVAAVTPVVYLLFFSTYTQWEGGYCYGPRYVVPTLVLLGLGVGPALDAASRKTRLLAIAVFAGGFFVQAIGSATSFLEADVVGAYYDAQYNYRMSFSPIAMQIHLLAHYARSAAAPIGRGFDKWWVFLSKAGVSTTALVLIAAVLVAGLVASGLALRRAYTTAAT
ncbi:MAG TPA: hypothetical protein VNY09_07280 [Candidatus Sulfotelmatobacter sp.]|jgi:hypothetical protein|nr:hypothetical protein [Candidatus Sulfotelmatobacter sp.]